MIEFLPEEKILCTVRRHWLVFVLENIGFVILALAPLIAIPFLGFNTEAFISSGQLFSAYAFFTGCWWLLLWLIFFTALTKYYLDILIVTNRRLIDIDQIGLFARDIATLPIENVEDVKIEVIGVLSTLFGFGNLHVQTAGTAKEIVLRGVKRPERAKQLIMSAFHDHSVRN